MKSLLILIIAGITFFVSGFGRYDLFQSSFQKEKIYGYYEMGDSVVFVFGQRNINTVGTIKFNLDSHRGDITSVNVAGEFNGWKPNDPNFRMKKDNKMFMLTLGKISIGKKGERKQFKFVLNGKYWIEPPKDVANKITGKDGNTNLYLIL